MEKGCEGVEASQLGFKDVHYPHELNLDFGELRLMEKLGGSILEVN